MQKDESMILDQNRKTGWKFFLQELKPKGKLLTPFNIISVPIVILGIVLIVIRFWKGIGAITNLTQEVPWGLWIGFDVVTGVDGNCCYPGRIIYGIMDFQVGYHPDAGIE